MNAAAILYPAIVLVFWTFVVLLMVPQRRFRAVRERRVTAKVDAWSVGLAWAYVGLRIAHSLVHVTYNNVIHRLRVFALSVVILLALWIRIVMVV